MPRRPTLRRDAARTRNRLIALRSTAAIGTRRVWRSVTFVFFFAFLAFLTFDFLLFFLFLNDEKQKTKTKREISPLGYTSNVKNPPSIEIVCRNNMQKTPQRRKIQNMYITSQLTMKKTLKLYRGRLLLRYSRYRDDYL